MTGSPDATVPEDKLRELLEDGQEEVFSRTAVEHGVLKDPNAMGPVDDEMEKPS